MHIARSLITVAALFAALPASAQTFYSHPDAPRRGNVDKIILDERNREPYYEVQRVPRYAPPRGSRYVGTSGVYVLPGWDRRMMSDPYRRQAAPRSARLGVPHNPAQTRRAIPEQFRRQIVAYDGSEAPGTVIINTSQRMLYLVQADGSAIRYGVGVGRDGFSWSGTHQVTEKKEWPAWRPPADMLQRRPDLPAFMEGGPDNPLGARAMYLGSTLYRIHGSNEPWTIGQAVSSGCFRMTNEDVQDLYERVPIGTTVKVI
jgi:lipoprotein-anchoring transpeptidase ErfK/SrfK